MSPRKPTPEEIRMTNPNVTKNCDSCNTLQRASETFGTFENALFFKVEGGYEEYVDTVFGSKGEYDFFLCHKCAHKLMKQFFPHWDFSHWHPRTTDKYCDGWRREDIPPFNLYAQYEDGDDFQS